MSFIETPHPHPRIHYTQLTSLRRLQDRLIKSTIKLIRLGAHVYVQHSTGIQDIDHSRLVAWDKNIGAVKRLLDKAHAVSYGVAHPYYAAISSHELISLLLGIGDHIRPGIGRNYDPIKGYLDCLLSEEEEDNAIDREAVLCVLKMIEEMSCAPRIYSLREVVVVSDQAAGPTWRTTTQGVNVNKPAVDPRAVQNMLR